MENMIEKLRQRIEEWEEEANTNYHAAAMGYDQGLFAGECNAYGDVLDLLDQLENYVNSRGESENEAH